MKKVRIFIATICMICAMTANAQPMNYNAMRNNARFLTDRIAYTLGITSAAIIDDIYRINFDYICGVNDYLDDVALGYYSNEYNQLCYERDMALQYLLGTRLWNRFITYDYFYRPIRFENRRWSFGIYAHDTRMNYFYRSVPVYFDSYRGGHFFSPMRPVRTYNNYNVYHNGRIVGPVHDNRVLPNQRGFDNRNNNGYHNNGVNVDRNNNGYRNNGVNVDRNNNGYRNNGMNADRNVNVNVTQSNDKKGNNGNLGNSRSNNNNVRSDNNARSSSRNNGTVTGTITPSRGTVRTSSAGVSSRDNNSGAHKSSGRR